MTSYSNLAYAHPSAPTRTPRAAEYEVIARITQRLSTASARRNENHPAFVEALALNEQLWSTLAVDVAGEGNGLPQALRARLFYLYQFTAEHSRKVRSGDANPEVLIEINTAVLRGLRGDGGAS
ncbi:MAG: flagellar biosynthesis regulator FlaF [Paracoccaceae bacterium]